MWANFHQQNYDLIEHPEANGSVPKVKRVEYDVELVDNIESEEESAEVASPSKRNDKRNLRLAYQP